MNWPQHQQQPDRWGHPPPPPRRSGGRTSPALLVFLAFVMAAALVIAIVVVVVSVRGSSGPQTAPPPPPAQQSADTPAQRSAEPTEDGGRVMQQGWQRAAAPKWGFVYEVPDEEGWDVHAPTAVYSFEGEDGTILGMSGVSVYLDTPCAGWGNRALLGAQGITDTDDTEEMAEAAARTWGYHAYAGEGREPEVTTRSVEEFSGNGLEGHYAVADVTVPGSDGECVPPEAVVHVVAAPARGDNEGLRAFVMVLDQGLPDTVDDGTAATVISTLRDADHEI